MYRIAPRSDSLVGEHTIVRIPRTTDYNDVARRNVCMGLVVESVINGQLTPVDDVDVDVRCCARLLTVGQSFKLKLYHHSRSRNSHREQCR